MLVPPANRGSTITVLGAAAAGKTSLARSLAALAERDLVELALTSGTDTSDLLGGFEQLEPRRRLQVWDPRNLALACLHELPSRPFLARQVSQVASLGLRACQEPCVWCNRVRSRLSLRACSALRLFFGCCKMPWLTRSANSAPL